MQELALPMSTSYGLGNTAPFKKMSLRRRVVGNSLSDFTGPIFKPRTSRSRDERVTAQPAKELISVDLSQRPIKNRALLELLSSVLIS